MVLDFPVLSLIRFGPLVVVANMRFMVVVKKRGHYIIQPQRQVSVLTLEKEGRIRYNVVNVIVMLDRYCLRQNSWQGRLERVGSALERGEALAGMNSQGSSGSDRNFLFSMRKLKKRDQESQDFGL